MYVPGISTSGNAEFNAEARGRISFPPALFEIFDEAGYQPAWFSYRPTGNYEGDSARYLASETRQSLEISARALDEQIRDLIGLARDEHPDAIAPQIVIVAHSLGGAVAARWASSADGDVLDTVRSIFTFDSPVAGIDVLRGLFGGDAGFDLLDSTEKARFEYGAGRVDFAQVGNLLDTIVPTGFSFTRNPWRRLNVSCLEPSIGTGHDCSKQEAVDNGFVDQTLAGVPPIWSGFTLRPGPLPEVLEITDLAWVDLTGAEIETARRGTPVTLKATGTGMAGLTVIVPIREVDIFQDDEVVVSRMAFLDSSGAATWTTLWMADELGGPEYVFSVLGFDSPLLTVN